MRDRTEKKAAFKFFFQGGGRAENGACHFHPLGTEVMKIEAPVRQVTTAADFAAAALFLFNDECAD